jgi:hypothetical protein
VLATDRLVRGRRELAWPVFAAGAFLFFALNVLGHHFFNFRAIGEPERLAPEFDLAAILISVEVLRRLWALRLPSTGFPAFVLKARAWLPKGLAVVLVLAAFGTSRHYLRKAWQLYRREPNYQQRVEYRIPEWLSKNLPGARSLVSGSVRFWFNAWHNEAQIGGGSEQGLRNPAVIQAFWPVLLEEAPEPSIFWMQSLGVDAVVVHDKTSQEHYHDFQFPKKFAGVLPVLLDDQQGNVIYQVPRRFPGLARVVEGSRVAALQPYSKQNEVQLTREYATLIEKGPNSPATSAWEGTDAMRIRARLQPGEALVVLASYDPAWHAYSRGSPLAIRKDAMGQMLIDAPPGEHDLRLVFETPLENRIGYILSMVSGLLVLVLIAKGVRA